ncbi:MAG: hypothetical protein A2583_13100 [Bdellovibrionales bacterium RIFOXYD1_FULL_53_11]|nr:MAG: hypothetical protein A2583_13100 [Bdellovibrionales bacterium RIFOXYD1_FULL_53_11]
MKRGRPKGRSNDKRSFGPLGDLIRKHRLEKKLGLLEVAKACKCSVQFISNIEHGRAPLPWDKIDMLAAYLKVPAETLRSANLSIRSDFRSFVNPARGKKIVTSPSMMNGLADAASIMSATTRDQQLCDLINRYQSANPAMRKRFLKTAMRMLAN